ncbi:MAG: zinc protease [Dasania sp.]|jgi:zinc protease
MTFTKSFLLTCLSCLLLFLSATQSWSINFTKINATQNHPEIWYMPTKTVPTISLQISFPIGYVFDPQDQLGLATLAAATLDEGAGTLNSDAFREALVNHQISLYYRASQEYLTLHLNFLKFDQQKALELAKLSLSQPRFDPNIIDLMRRQLTNSIQSSQKNPTIIASTLLRQHYYKDHLFAKPAYGTIKTLNTITKKDLVDFHKKLSIKNAFISITGDISQKEATLLSTALLENLPKQTTHNHKIPDYEKGLIAEKFAVHLDVPQSTIIMVTPTIKRNDPDFISYYLATHILGGGGFGSRLINDLREEKGLTYSISAALDSSLYDGRMMIQFATDNQNVPLALKEVNNTLADLAQNGVTQIMLDKAKTYLKGQYALGFETNNDITSLAQGLYHNQLPFDYAQQRNALFDKVTLKDVNQKMTKILLQPLTMIVVGGNKNIKNFNMLPMDAIKF